MKKLTTIILIASALLLGSCGEQEDSCMCEKVTYKLKYFSQSGLIKLKYVEINRETVLCQDENKWHEGEFRYEIECK